MLKKSADADAPPDKRRERLLAAECLAIRGCDFRRHILAPPAAEIKKAAIRTVAH